MSENTLATWGLLVTLVFLMCVGALTYQRDTLKREAVERGHAEWVVRPNGDTTWKWKEVTKP